MGRMVLRLANASRNGGIVLGKSGHPELMNMSRVVSVRELITESFIAESVATRISPWACMWVHVSHEIVVNCPSLHCCLLRVCSQMKSQEMSVVMNTLMRVNVTYRAFIGIMMNRLRSNCSALEVQGATSPPPKPGPLKDRQASHLSGSGWSPCQARSGQWDGSP